MPADLPFDEDLARRLPLPLAQLYRRAHNAKSPQEQHHASYYLWEAALKLLGAAAVGAFLAAGRRPGPDLAERLQNLARPSVGHWWELVRLLTAELADADPAFATLRELLLGKARDDLPRVAGLDAALLASLEGRRASRTTVRLAELFDRLVRYRNREFGHGAVGQRETAHYDEVGRALLAGLPPLLARLNVLAGRRLVYIADVRRLSSGAWLVERYELAGEAPRRLESLEVTHEEAAGLLPQRVYLDGSTSTGTRQSLHPLVCYDFEANEALFLNARRGRQRVEYLGYTTGRVLDRLEPGAQNALLAELLGMPVDEAQLLAWQARSQAEEGPAPEEGGPGRLLGEFELLSELGRGGMGVVYRAWQPSLGRQVALKCLLRGGDPKAEARFAREIAALGRVEHPHLVRIFTSGAEGERWFYAMELVEGATLAAVCERLAGSGALPDRLDLPTWQEALSTTCESARRAERPLAEGAEVGAASRAAPAEDAASPGGVTAEESASARRTYVRHVADLVRQVAEAAQALHECGIVHRDIKPGNILVSPDGATATLMDLGLAQLADEAEGRLTRTRQFVGTLRYASPEQVLAVARLDRRSDVYSLGATLWELLTLRPLYGANEQTPTPELMQKIQIEEPGRLHPLNPSVPRDLEAVVQKCLQKDPKKRYATAADLARELADFLAGRPVHARPVSTPERAWMWARRRPAQAGLIGSAALLLVGLVVGVLVFAWQARQGRVRAEESARQQATLRQEADDQSKVAQARAISLAWNQGQTLCNQGDPGRGLPYLVRALEIAEGVDRVQARSLGRDITAWGRRLSPLQRVIDHRAPLTALAVSANGLLGLTSDPEGRGRLWDLKTAESLGEVLFKGEASAAAFSPDGGRVLVGSRLARAELWNVMERVREREIPHDGVLAVAISPDGATLLTGGTYRTACLWEAATGRQKGASLVHPSAVTGVGFGAAGVVVTTSRDGSVTLWDGTGKRLGRLRPHAGETVQAVSPDGSSVATGGEDGTVGFWSLRDLAQARPPLPLSLSAGERLQGLRFSADGERLLTWHGTTAQVWDLTAREPVGQPLRHPRRVVAAAFLPGGAGVLTAGLEGTVRVWGTPDDGPALVLRHPYPLRAVAWQPQGRRVLTAGGADPQPGVPPSGEVRLWDGGTGQQQRMFEHPYRVSTALFSPDGAGVAAGCDDGEVWVRAVDTGAMLGKPMVHERHEPVPALAFSPDGLRLLTGTWGGKLRLWRAGTGEVLSGPHAVAGKVRAVAVQPGTGLLLCGGTNRTVQLWEGLGVAAKEALPHPEEVTAAAVDPGDRLVTGCADGLVRLWRVSDGAVVRRVPHGAPVRAVAFGAGGEVVGSAGERGLRLWCTRTGRALGPALLPSQRLTSLAFSPDGAHLIVGEEEGVASMWVVPSPLPETAAALRRRLQRQTGLELDDDDALCFLDVPAWDRLRPAEGR